MSARRLTGVSLATGVGLMCALTAGGSMTTTDAVIAYDVTRAIVDRGSIALGPDAPHYESYRGRDGRYYSPFGVAQSVWNIPFYLGGRAAAGALGGRASGSEAIPKAAVALATVPAVALLAWVSFDLLVALGASMRRAAGAALLLVFGTSLWPYSGFGFNQPLTALFLWAAVLGAVRSGAGRGWRAWALFSGACAGLAMLTRHEMAAAALLVGGYLAWREPRRLDGPLRLYAAGLLPMVALWCGLNWWRYGSPLESGYLRDDTPGFGSSVIAGGAGLLFSPYSSLLLYAPVTILAAFGLRALWRRNRPAAALFVALFAAYFVLYSSLGNWMGGRSYGPRYLVPLLPALVLPIAFWTPSRRWRLPAAAIAVFSVLVQLPGVLVDYSKVRMERAVAGETTAQDTRWRAAPLLLNARAARENGRLAVAFLSGAEAPVRVRLDDPGLSTALSFSLDFWWLYLAYLGAIGRETALAIAAALAAAAMLGIRTAWLTAATAASSGPPS